MSKRPKRRGYLDAAIVASWRRHEEADISTERLMEIVRGAAGAHVNRRIEELQRPACCANKDPSGDAFDPVSCLLRFSLTIDTAASTPFRSAVLRRVEITIGSHPHLDRLAYVPCLYGEDWPE